MMMIVYEKKDQFINVWFQQLSMVIDLLWCGGFGRERVEDLIQVKIIMKKNIIQFYKDIQYYLVYTLLENFPFQENNNQKNNKNNNPKQSNK